MVPREFPNECIVKHPTPYEAVDPPPRATQPRKGTLDIGRVVWTKKSLGEAEATSKVDAFVYGVGPVELDAKDLTQN